MMPDPVLVDDWHVVARAVDVGQDQPFATALLDQRIVLWRSNGSLMAWRDQCPHRGTRLSLGEIRDGDTLSCPYHGWRFDTSGRCVMMPAHPDMKPSPRARTTVYRVLERYGLIWVSLGNPRHEVPELVGLDEDYRLIITGPYEVDTSGPRAVENFLDMSHFPFVHSGYLGQEPFTEIRDYDVEVVDAGVIARNCRAYQPRTSSVATEGAEVAYSYRILRPLTAMLTKEPGATGGKPDELIMLTVQPLTEERVRAWFLLAMTYAHGQPERQFIDFQDTIFLQDKPVLESQSPKRLPLNPTMELHQRADRLSLAYRRWLQRLGMRHGVIRDEDR